MREWIRSRKGQAIVLVALAVIAILTTSALLGPGRIGAPTETASVAESPGVAKPTPTHTGTPRPTPTPSTTIAPDASAPPEQSAAGEPPAPQPAPPQTDGELPAIIGMDLGPSTGCGADPTGQTDYLTFSWGARDGNTVDVYYALTDTDVQASSGFILLGSSLATNGSVQIPRTCPNGTEPPPYLTIKVVANNAYGSAAAFYWGL